MIAVPRQYRLLLLSSIDDMLGQCCQLLLSGLHSVLAVAGHCCWPLLSRLCCWPLLSTIHPLEYSGMSLQCQQLELWGLRDLP